VVSRWQCVRVVVVRRGPRKRNENVVQVALVVSAWKRDVALRGGRTAAVGLAARCGLNGGGRPLKSVRRGLLRLDAGGRGRPTMGAVAPGCSVWAGWRRRVRRKTRPRPRIAAVMVEDAAESQWFVSSLVARPLAGQRRHRMAVDPRRSQGRVGGVTRDRNARSLWSHRAAESNRLAKPVTSALLGFRGFFSYAGRTAQTISQPSENTISGG